jgi:hypothetical protein
MEELLDDHEIKRIGIAPVQEELSKFKFWLYFSAVLFLIVGGAGLLFVSQLLLDSFSYYNSWPLFVFIVGMFIAFLLALPMGYTHIVYARSAQNNSSIESEENFIHLAKSSTGDWRLLALAFLFSGIAVAQLFSYEVYSDINRDIDIDKPIPEELIQPAIEDVEIPWDESPAVEKEEDPAPPQN